MPKDVRFRDRQRDVAKKAKREFAKGEQSSFDHIFDDRPYPKERVVAVLKAPEETGATRTARQQESRTLTRTTKIRIAHDPFVELLRYVVKEHKKQKTLNHLLVKIKARFARLISSTHRARMVLHQECEESLVNLRQTYVRAIKILDDTRALLENAEKPLRGEPVRRQSADVGGKKHARRPR